MRAWTGGLLNVFTYLRVSGLGQVDKDGFPRQREAIQDFLSAHKLVNLGEFVEDGVSGTVEGADRPTFRDLLMKAESLGDLKIEAIVVERMSRLARDLMVSELLLKECRERKIKVFCADQGHLINMAEEDGDPTRVLFRQILGALSQWEKSCLVSKLRSARKRHKLQGLVCEGKKPFGDTQRERDILEEMEMLKAIGNSYADVAAILNEKGYKTRHSKLWNKSNVHTALSGRRCKKG